MDNGDEPPAVLPAVRNAVVLGLDDDVFQRAGLGQLKEHTQELPLLLDVPHQNRHAAAPLQGAELLHHAVVHGLHKGVPGGNPGKIGLPRVIAVAGLYVRRLIHDIGILDDIPVGRMPENELGPLRNIAVEQVEAAVEVVGVAGDPHAGGGVSGGIASAHIVADLLGVEVGDQVLDQPGEQFPR